MDGRNAIEANDNDNENLDTELNQLTETLRALNIQQRQLRRQSDRVQLRIRNIEREQRRRTNIFVEPAVPIRRDRHGDILDMGDYVNFLTRGRFNSRAGTVTQITNVRFITARDRSGRLINREPSNVEIVRKYNEDDDRRQRYE